MKRLTKRNIHGVPYYPECFDKCAEKGPSIKCHCCYFEHEIIIKLAEYEDLEEQERLIKLPESDWNHLIKQLEAIVANDFIVYSDEREYIVNQIFFLEYDEEFRFSATCRCFNGTENDWWCDEECKYGEDGNCCYIDFSFSDIGKTVFLTKEEAEKVLEMGE